MLRRNHGVKGFIQKKLSKPLRRAKAIVAIGSRAKNDYQQRFPNARVEQLPYFCDLTKFKRERPKNPEPVFLFCGQMIERKGIDLLIQAFDRIRGNGIKAKLILAGRETPLTQKLHPDIEIAGFTAPSDLPDLFARADVFVLPSRHDGWGVVINQAIGAGLPIISSTAVGAATDLVESGTNGVLVPPGQLEPLTEAIRNLALDPSARESMAKASAEKAEQLDPAIGVRQWYKILTCASS